jgi:hypothetical protein
MVTPAGGAKGIFVLRPGRRGPAADQFWRGEPASAGVKGEQMNVVRVGLVGLFCALVGTGVATAANGSGAGPISKSTVAPVAQSGNTGNVNISSSAINSGATGASNSSAVAGPTSHAGGAGGASSNGPTGQALSTAKARPASNGGAGGANSAAVANSSANSGAKSEGIGTSGASGPAANSGNLGAGFGH